MALRGCASHRSMYYHYYCSHTHTHIHLHPRYHPQIGLKTIAETEVEVSKLQQQILAFRPQLEKQQESNDEMLKVISLRTHEA